MSLAHIRLSKVSEDRQEVCYKVESIDFTDGGTWEVLGTLLISKADGRYEFLASDLAKREKLIPPQLYALPEATRRSCLEGRYSGYGWGAWAMCINAWANDLIKQARYPDKYPR